MGLAHSVTVEDPFPLTGTYLALLPKDIWRYCISSYLNYSYSLASWGSYLQPPRLRQIIPLLESPHQRIFYINRLGQVYFAAKTGGDRIWQFNPRTLVTSAVIGPKTNTKYHLEWYHWWTDTLILSVQPGNPNAPCKMKEIANVSTLTSPAKPVLRYPIFQHKDSLTLRFSGGILSITVSSAGEYRFMMRDQLLYSGQLSHLKPDQNIHTILYHGGYLIVIASSPDEVQLYQIIYGS